jgi:hypothetical protein
MDPSGRTGLGRPAGHRADHRAGHRAGLGRGFTVVEILVVLGIVIGVISTLVVGLGYAARRARVANTEFLMNSIVAGMTRFRAETGYIPPILGDAQQLSSSGNVTNPNGNNAPPAGWLRNALLPIMTFMAIWIGTAISGSVVVEVVFDWPGVGSMFVDSIAMRDFPMIQAIVGLVAVSVIGANLIVDLLYGVVDPRIRIDAASPST